MEPQRPRTVEKHTLEACYGRRGRGAEQTKAMDGLSSRLLICVRPPPPTDTAKTRFWKPEAWDHRCPLRGSQGTSSLQR